MLSTTNKYKGIGVWGYTGIGDTTRSRTRPAACPAPAYATPYMSSSSNSSSRSNNDNINNKQPTSKSKLEVLGGTGPSGRPLAIAIGFPTERRAFPVNCEPKGKWVPVCMA